MTQILSKYTTIIKRKCFQNIFLIASCGLCFFIGNLLATLSIDPSKCSIEMCNEKIKRTEEDYNQWIGQGNTFHKNSKTTVFLIVLILSSPTNQEQRGVIRETWLSDEMPDTAHYFIIGTGSVTDELNSIAI